MNRRIRNDIKNYIALHGPTDSRVLIEFMANKFYTPKQRISGNIFYMVCKLRNISIIRNKPNSILY